VERPSGNGAETHSYRLIRLERDQEDDRKTVKELSDRIDKLTLAVVGFALTLAVFGLGIAVTLLTTRTG
jgi:hypothetical protein